jgi:energy-coupling factor transport system permease protein
MNPLTAPDSTAGGAASLLHRVDPRLKLLGCGVLATLAFAAATWPPLAVTALAVAGLAALAGRGPGWLLSTLWPLRWLLLFSLLLHLLLSPGHTLFGVAWLSRDGLLRGLLVCAQLSVAYLAATLLTQTTPVELTARACGWLLAPLRRCGCSVHRWEELMTLVLRFFPMLRDEARATAVSGDAGWVARIGAWEERLLPLIDRLVERADRLARQVAAGEESLRPTVELPASCLAQCRDRLFFAGSVGVFILYLLAG